MRTVSKLLENILEDGLTVPVINECYRILHLINGGCQHVVEQEASEELRELRITG